jgi:glycogen operon protein
VFRRRRFLQGRPVRGEGVKDIYWLAPEGREMEEADWTSENGRCLGVALLGDQIDETGERGERITGNSYLLLLNARGEEVSFRVGGRARSLAWERVFDTAHPGGEGAAVTPPDTYQLSERSLALLRLASPRPG